MGKQVAHPTIPRILDLRKKRRWIPAHSASLRAGISWKLYKKMRMMKLKLGLVEGAT